MAQFGEAFPQLLAALRRASTKSEGSQQKGEAGRFSKRAEALDLQLISMGSGSTTLDYEVVISDEKAVADLDQDQYSSSALAQFLADLEKAAQGQASTPAAYRLAKTLTNGGATASLVAEQHGSPIGHPVRISPNEGGNADASEFSFRRITGILTGLSMPPDACRIRIYRGTGQAASLGATPDQVSSAEQLLGKQVEVLLLSPRDRRDRVLWLRSAGHRFPLPAPAPAGLVERWDNLLERLS